MIGGVYGVLMGVLLCNNWQKTWYFQTKNENEWDMSRGEGELDETTAPCIAFERTINHTTMSVREGVYVLYI